MKLCTIIFATFIVSTSAIRFPTLNVGHLAQVDEETNNDECIGLCAYVDIELRKCKKNANTKDYDVFKLAECVCKKDDDFFPELIRCVEKCDKIPPSFVIQGGSPRDSKQRICKIAGIQFNASNFTATTTSAPPVNGAATLGASFLALVGILMV